MEREQEDQIRDFVEYLTNLTPNEVALIASLSGMFLGQFLSPLQQNVFGNFFELLGQILLSMGAQGEYINATKENDYNPKIINDSLPKKRN